MSPRGKKQNSITKPKKNPAKKKRRSSVSKSKSTPSVSALPIGLWEYSIKTGKFGWSAFAREFIPGESLPVDIAALVLRFVRQDRNGFKSAFTRAIKSGSEISLEVRSDPAYGSERWIEFNGSGVRRRTGDAVKYSGTVRDITKRKQAEFELTNWRIKNELIAQSAGLLIYDYNIETGDIHWDGSVSEILGFTSEDMNRIEKWEELIHPDDRAEAYDLLEKSRHELKPYDVYYRFRNRQGDYCYIHDRGLYVPDEKGEAHRMLGVMSDVTPQVNAMNNVAASDKSYRELFNSVGEAIYIQDAHGTFLDVNAEACRMYGYSKAELVGKNPGFLSAPDRNDFDALLLSLRKALAGQQQTFHWWGRKKNGELILKEVRMTRGSYFGNEAVIATALDITEKRKTASVLQESERRFERMIEDLNVGVVLLDANSRLLTVNRAAKEILNLDKDSTGIEGHVTFITEAGDTLDYDMAPWEIVKRTKTAIRSELIGIAHTPERVSWFLVNSDPSLHDHELAHIMVTFTDITERKRMEEHWKESELRFRTLQEASYGGIGLHRLGLIVDCNQGLCDLTGFEYEELIGMNGINLIAPEFRDIVVERIVSKSTTPYDVVGVRKDGSRYFLEIHGKNIPYKDGQLRVTEFRDITARKLAEEKILEQNARLLLITEDLRQKNDQLQEFTQIVSHNLRSPVGNILSLLSLIENAQSEEERRDAIELLKEAGTGTLTTLTELNQVLQIQQNRNMERQHLVFAEVFNGVKILLNAKIAEAGAVIHGDFEAAPTLSYPRIYLESIILNLLSNALKYSHPDRKPEILVRTVTNADGSVTMFVHDNGRGIDMSRYGHQVFKLRKTFHRHPESRGIGLFMIKNQIETMGGSISLSSVENEGSVFQVDFKRAHNHEQ